MPQDSSLRPPYLASWLLDLFTPLDQAESIPGDLLEEFSMYTSKHNLRSARRWYWRQSLKSIAHLFLAAFRTSSFSITSAVFVGLLLLRWSTNFSEFGWSFLHLIHNHVTPYHADWVSYVYDMNISILVAVLLFRLLIGGVVALIAKGKELVATMTLILIFDLTQGAFLFSARFITPYPHPLLEAILLGILQPTVMLLLGAWIIRGLRLAKSRKLAQGL
jgi:hypothetical protein